MTVEYKTPVKKILTKEDLDAFHHSAAYFDLLEYLDNLNAAVKGQKLGEAGEQSNTVQAIVRVLEAVEKICQDTPPIDNEKSRFGNPAFQEFYDKVVDKSPALQTSINVPTQAIQELSSYLNESWGNRKRIDYGTGHETNFIAWLLCLYKLGLLQESDHKATVLVIFNRYLQVMRKLQMTYWLEPAGSHGVWGLDDYHFMPFLFGSSQLRGHKYIRPKSIHDADIVDQFSKDYMYLSCVAFINSIKTASLQWHSPMLNDISGVKTWEKVNEGMLKMYKGEVLAKLPIMQHFMCGSLLVFEGGHIVPEDDLTDNHDHDHVHAFGQEYPDCCVIPVPSAIAAKMANGQTQIRRLPFD